MPYGEIITSAARLIWRHKILWLFGLLASCAAGGSRFNYNLDSSNFSSAGSGVPQPLVNLVQTIERVIGQTPVLFFVLLFLFICGLSIVLFLVGIFGRTGLARGAWLADSGSESLSFGQLVSQSAAYFWRVTGLSLLVGLPGFAVSLISAIMFIFFLAGLSNARESGGAIVVLLCVMIPLICLLVPVFWLLGMLSELCTVAIVGEGLGVFAAIQRGWGLFRRHLGSVVLTALLILAAQFAFGIVQALILAPIGLGALLGASLLGNNLQFNLGIFVVLGLVLVPIMLFVGAVFQAYLGTVWALVFRRLAAAEVPPAPAPTPQVPDPLPPVVVYPTGPDSPL